MAAVLTPGTEALKSCIALAHSAWREKNSHAPANETAFIDFVRALQNDGALWDSVLARPEATLAIGEAAATLRGALASLELPPDASLSGLLTAFNLTGDIQQQLITLISQSGQRESRISAAFSAGSPAATAQQLEQLANEKPVPDQLSRLFALCPAETGRAKLFNILLWLLLGFFGIFIFTKLTTPTVYLYKGVTPDTPC